MYKDGIEVEKNYSEALKWFKEAAEKNYGDAESGVGECYKNGLGVEKNFNKAIFWYERGIKHRGCIAYLRLAQLGEARKIQIDFDTICEYYLRAEELDSTVASLWFIMRFRARNKQVQKWLEKHADEGNEEAAYLLGAACNYLTIIYLLANEPIKNVEIGEMWLKRGIDAECEESIFLRGILRLLGIGRQKSSFAAYSDFMRLQNLNNLFIDIGQHIMQYLPDFLEHYEAAMSSMTNKSRGRRRF